MANSVDPDQLASEEANWSGSTLFAMTVHVVFSKRRVKWASLLYFQSFSSFHNSGGVNRYKSLGFKINLESAFQKL